MTYVLGLPSIANQKTDMGTICHKVLEILAAVKQADQNGENYISDDVVGQLFFNQDWMKPTFMTEEEIVAENKSRSAKTIYKYDCLLPKNHVRYGVEFVNKIIDKVYDYYTKKLPHHEWTGATAKQVKIMSWIALDFKNGMFDPRKRQILSPERGFDFPIEEAWAKNADGEYLRLKGTVDLITKIDDTTIEIIDWKGLPIETPIPTLNGWSTIGELNIGDVVFDKDGKQTKIIGKSKQKNKPCYKITFDDKTEVICDNEHLWTKENGDVVSILDLKIKDKISVAKPIIILDKTLPVDPYVLGIWLGDDRNRNSEITNSDSFIFEEIARRGYVVGENIGGKDRCEQRIIFELKDKLRKLDLLHNKHIPTIYFRASFQQRLDLLRGLMDSDGNVNSVRKQGVFTNCNKKLSDDVKELLLTLGQRPNQCHTKQKGFGLTVDCYPIHFRPININPFLLPRKADRILNWGSGLSNRRLIKNIESIDNKETQCIMVDSPTNTYLCTENMIPTHNTGQRIDWAAKDTPIKDFNRLCKDTQLMLYYYAVREMYPEYPHVILSIFFIRDGGPFSICFDEETIDKIKNKIKATASVIKDCDMPKMISSGQTDFRCTRLCHFYKNNWPGTNKNMCQYVHDYTKKHGIEKASEDLRRSDFSTSDYKAPGE